MTDEASRNAFLTPDSLEGEEVTLGIKLHPRLFRYVFGALGPLMGEENWEDYGAVTPAAVSQYFINAVMNMERVKVGLDVGHYTITNSVVAEDSEVYWSFAHLSGYAWELYPGVPQAIVLEPGSYLVTVAFAAFYTSDYNMQVVLRDDAFQLFRWKSGRVELAESVNTSFSFVVTKAGYTYLNITGQLLQTNLTTLDFSTYTPKQVSIVRLA